MSWYFMKEKVSACKENILDKIASLKSTVVKLCIENIASYILPPNAFN